jgi:hypothetical protein
MEQAVTSALPGDAEAYFFDPLLIWHTNGKCYGVLGAANQALAWQRGLSPRDREYFYLTDLYGQRVTVEAQPKRPSHAYTIMEKLR